MEKPWVSVSSWFLLKIVHLTFLSRCCFSNDAFIDFSKTNSQILGFPWDIEIKYPGSSGVKYAKAISTPAELHVEGNYLYVACFKTDQVLRLEVDSDGILVQPQFPEIFAEGFYCLVGPRDCVRLVAPWGVDSGRNGEIFVSSFDNDVVLKFDSESGDYLGTLGNSEELNGPEGLAFDPETGLLFVSNYLDGTVVAYNTEAGVLEHSFSSPFLDHPQGMVLDAEQQLFVCSSRNNSINVFERNGTLIDVITDRYLEEPTSISVDYNGDILVSSYKGWMEVQL